MERYPLHLERHAPLGYQVEKLLQRKALDMQAQLTLAQLNPVGQHVIIVGDLVGKLTYIGRIALLRRLGFMEDTVD